MGGEGILKLTLKYGYQFLLLEEITIFLKIDKLYVVSFSL